MIGKKHLWIPLTLMLLTSIAMVSVSVKAPPPEYETRLHIRECPPPDGYVDGTTVPTQFSVKVDIESPSEWDNTPAGIIGFYFNVHVDPTVLLPMEALGAASGNFLYDFIDFYNYTGHEPQLLVEDVDPNAGDITGVGGIIMGWETLGVGAGGSSYSGSAYGSVNGLCRLKFYKMSSTAFTRIEITDASWVDTAGQSHPFDVVDCGRYNPAEYRYLTVESTPTTGIDFTIGTTAYTTNVVEAKLEKGNHVVTMPDPGTVGTDKYMFVEWEDASTNPVRVVSLTSNMTITATYEHREARLNGKKAWPEHHHFDISKHGNVSVDDPKGTPGYNTLFAKVKNYGELNVTVKVVFELMLGETPAPLTETAPIELTPGEIGYPEADFSGLDGYPWSTAEDTGTWKCSAVCKYYNPYTDCWESADLAKIFKFAVVP